MQEIKDFIAVQCGDPAKNAFEPPATFEGLVELLADFQKSGDWQAGMAEAIAASMEESRMQRYIAHERQQRLFIAANSAMNGILSNPSVVPGNTARIEYALGIAKSLISEIEKEQNNG